MKLPRTFAAMLLTACIASCDSNDPEPQDLVTFTLEVNQEAWMFASDAEGKVLDYKQLVFKEPVTLSAERPGETFSLTFILRLTPRAIVFDITTYTGISPGSKFAPKIYQPEEFGDKISLGKATVRVTNYPLEQELPLVVSDPWQSTSYFSSGQSTPTFALNVWQSQQPRFMFSGYQDDLLHPVYTFIDPVDVGATLSADFTTFVPFEKTIELKGFDTPLEGKVLFQLYGYSTSTPPGAYKLTNLEWTYNGTSPTVRAGYLDDFAKYYVSMSAFEIERQTNTLKKALSYTHLGAIDKPVKFPDDDLTVSNTTMGAFAFAFSGEYQMRSHQFENQTNFSRIDWAVYSSPDGPSLIIEIPKEILDKYPDMQPGDMRYSASSFYTFDDGFNYGQILEEKFKTSFGPDHSGYVQRFPNNNN